MTEDENAMMSTPVCNSMLERWGITKSELYVKAMSNLYNSEVFIKDIFEVLSDSAGIPFEEFPNSMPKMYVVTNSQKCFGASMILSKQVRKMLVDYIGEDILIIPSSVHEVLAIPYNKDEDPTAIEVMIKEVNATQVDPAEQLSNHPYYIDSKSYTLHCF